jgi:hypothetical protein
MVISLRKTIPATSDFYTTGGDTTITLAGVIEITLNSKKSLIKIQRPITPSRQTATPSDEPSNTVIDLKKIEESIVIRGWLEDESASVTAWQKAWKLRAMVTTGGQLTSFVWDNLTFSSATIPAQLESVTVIQPPQDTQSISSTTLDTGSSVTTVSTGQARLEVNLTLYLGSDRRS